MTKKTSVRLCGTAFAALSLTVAVAICCLSMSGCGSSKKHEYRLTYSVFFPPVHVQTVLAVQWAKEIEKRTNGRVQVDVFPGGVLSGAAENYDCIINGVSDLGMSCLSYSRGLFPLMECLDFPMGYPDGKIATLVANDFLRHFMPKELEETHMLYLHAHGPGILAARKSTKTLDDIKKLSIRGTGITAQVIRQLGGNAVGLPQGETFEALRKGVVDATLCPIETLKGWKQGEVIDEVVSIPSIGYTTAMFVAMNKKTWNKLPDDIRQVILDVNKEWIPKHGQAWDDADQEGRTFVKNLGKHFSAFSVEEDAKAAKELEPLIQRWIAQAEAKGLPGREAIDFIRERIKFHSNNK